ncbi:MAG: three-Cys-motif partner protein TcmP [Chloroflexota bacterium]
MVQRHYDWVCGGSLPVLMRHSEVKHALLRDYLVDYFLTLVSSPRQDKITLTIVDGFCGGGRYVTEAGDQAPGSPIVILRALKEAEARIYHEQQREKSVEIDAELICIDEDESAINHLRWVLEDEGYGDKLRSERIRLLKGQFGQHADDVIRYSANRSKRSGKAIFVLDQYGYSEVPLPALQNIFSTLGKAEIILTFNVDSLINYLSDQNLASFERKTGFEGALTAADLDAQVKGPHWRRQIQAKLYANITSGSGARHFTPFFIRPEKGHGDFWLLHLSQHSKARDVMAEAHWRHNNHFVHYGQAGLDMFGVGYAAKLDDTDKPQAAFEFDDIAAGRSRDSMLTEIPRILSATQEGLVFGEFFISRCNNTPATREMIEKATLELVRHGHVEVVGQDGGKRYVTAAIQDDHVIRIPKQTRFFF